MNDILQRGVFARGITLHVVKMIELVEIKISISPKSTVQNSSHFFSSCVFDGC